MVQVSAPEAPRQPQPGARAYQPNPATGYGLPPGGNVVPIHLVQSCKLVRQGVDRNGVPVDPYRDFLDTLPDISPEQAQARGVNARGLVPTEEEARSIPRAVAYDPNTEAHDDPAADAYGTRPATARRSSPFLVGGGG